MTVAATGSFDQEIGLGSLSNCVADKAAEYRYDSAIQRYLVRPRDPVTLDVLPGALWRDYDSENIYVDYAIDPATGDVTHGTAYQAGIGIDDPAASDMPGYFAGDQIGTTRAISGTNAEGPPVLRESAYTAFGEAVASTGSFDTRYGYAGAWGYETAESLDPMDELGWLHVGERYYDPSSGRFLQRDPLGIGGSLNVYAYVENEPVRGVDPNGLQTMIPTVPGGSVRPPAPRVNRSGGPMPDVCIQSRARLVDAFCATGCSLIGQRYYVAEPVEKCWCLMPPYDSHHLHPGSPPRQPLSYGRAVKAVVAFELKVGLAFLTGRW